MVSDLKSRFEKLDKLDKERTQGEWVTTKYQGCEPDETFNWVVFNECAPGASYTLRINDQRERDARFIAAAPEAIQLARDAVARVKCMEAQLNAVLSLSQPLADKSGTHAAIVEFISTNKRVDFKNGDTHCSDCPCRFGHHLTKPVPERREWQSVDIAPHDKELLLGWWYTGTPEPVFRYEISKYSWDYDNGFANSKAVHGRAEYWMYPPAATKLQHKENDDE